MDKKNRTNEEIVYDNPKELLELLNSSKSLKAFHPDLYKKYAFEANMDVLCRLQLSRDLPEQFEEKIKSAQAILKESNIKRVAKEPNEIGEKYK